MSNLICTSRFDEFYIKEDHSSVPKEYFKEALNIIGHRLVSPRTNILDVGCAAGDFLRYVYGQYPEINCHGLDAFPNLLSEAKKRVPNGTFHLGDMNSDNVNNFSGQYDVVTMLGVLSIFSTENWIDNFTSLVKPTGLGLIFGMVNPYPYDVFIRLRNDDGIDEYGWNSWSAGTLTKRFKQNGFNCKINYWQPSISIPQRPNEPLRSWTTELRDGGCIITNGSRMIHDFAFVTVESCS
jgi:cyclopropane fatty-acyl-phospholipid synthase-like methyltransferase